MCATCGCSNTKHLLRGLQARPTRGEALSYRPREHSHLHGRAEARTPAAPTRAEDGRTLTLEEAVLAKNDALARENRAWLAKRAILALNLVSAPGSGKTTLLVRTIAELAGNPVVSVLGGDQATANDTERIAATGCRALQINTGAGCHLDADMVARGMAALDPPAWSVLMIENVGNLVCPAMFDLGEDAKVVMLSVTEGEDKPLKYPHMFRAARLMLLTKIDLLPHLAFDVASAIECARRVNPALEILQLSASSGEGMDAWCAWLRDRFERRPQLHPG